MQTSIPIIEATLPWPHAIFILYFFKTSHENLYVHNQRRQLSSDIDEQPPSVLHDPKPGLSKQFVSAAGDDEEEDEDDEDGDEAELRGRSQTPV